MPLYEYGCPACGTTTDVRHGFDEKPQLACERCSGVLTRQFSAPPIVFKGSGFYVTDSRSKNGSSEKPSKTEATTESKTETKGEGKAETSGETKVEKKTDAAA